MSPRSGLLLFAVALALCACPARADGPAEGYKRVPASRSRLALPCTRYAAT